MRRFLSLLTIVMLFAHAVLGCCAHHVHACGETHDPVGLCTDGTAGLASGHSHQLADSEPGGSEPGNSEHQQRDDCQGSKCDFGRPVNDQDQTIRFHAPLSHAVAWTLPAISNATLDGDRKHQLGTSGADLQPPRRHLLYQVFLI